MSDAPTKISFSIGRFPNGAGLGSALSAQAVGLALTGLAQVMRGRIVGAFAVGGHHLRGGQKWKNLAFSTILRKGSSAILIDSGRLRNTIKTTVRGNTIQITADTPYARYHQRGTLRMPQRKVLELTKQDEAWAAAKVADFANRLINGAAPIGGAK